MGWKREISLGLTVLAALTICCRTQKPIGKISDKLGGKFEIVQSTKKRLVKRGALKFDQSAYNRIEEFTFDAFKRCVVL